MRARTTKGRRGGREARSLQSQRPEEARVSRIGDRPQGTLEPRAVGQTAPRPGRLRAAVRQVPSLSSWPGPSSVPTGPSRMPGVWAARLREGWRA